jgi:aryl-alcohol dehydrogenase-like predicted oxidoreductase
MFTKRLGRSGIEVSALGLGCMEIGGAMIDMEQIDRLLGRAPKLSALLS